MWSIQDNLNFPQSLSNLLRTGRKKTILSKAIETEFSPGGQNDTSEQAGRYSGAPSPNFSSDAVFHSIFCFRLTSDKPGRMGMVCLQDKKRGRKSIKFTTLSPEFFGSHQSSLLKLLLSDSFHPTFGNRLRHGIYQTRAA